MRPETLAIHAGLSRRDGGMSPSLQLSTTFAHGPAYELLHGHAYSRHSGPNVCDLETRLCALEGGAAGAVCFASGVAATAGVLGVLPQGARVVFPAEFYLDNRRLALLWAQAGRLQPVFLDLFGEAQLPTDTALVWLETPSNPRLQLSDIEAISRKAHAIGARVAVDSTFATPLLQSPLLLGADYVVHALTKYIGGHSDAMGGVVLAGDPAALEPVRTLRALSGGVLSPFNAWLCERGAATLPVRMERHCANALYLANWLSTHPAVDVVHYPFLPSHPRHALAQRQMRAGGGVVSFELRGGREAALAVAGAVRLFCNATSFGGVESLIEHRASVEGAGATSPQGLLRLAVGLEHVQDLKEDLAQALAQVR